jgi:hypothetical protein
VTELAVDRLNYSNILLSFVPRKSFYSGEEVVQKTLRLKIKKGMAFLEKFLKGIKYYNPEMKIILNEKLLGEQ